MKKTLIILFILVMYGTLVEGKTTQEKVDFYIKNLENYILELKQFELTLLEQEVKYLKG